jgi:hypothetical protein
VFSLSLDRVVFLDGALKPLPDALTQALQQCQAASGLLAEK